MALPLNYFRQSKQTGRHIATSKTYRQIFCHAEIHYSGLISEKNVLLITANLQVPVDAQTEKNGHHHGMTILDMPNLKRNQGKATAISWPSKSIPWPSEYSPSQGKTNAPSKKKIHQQLPNPHPQDLR